MEEKRVFVKPKIKMIPVTLRDAVIGEDGKFHEVTRTIMMPDFIMKDKDKPK